jgi:putative phosphoesterase
VTAEGTRTAQPLRLGLLSDTHGLLRPEALAALADCDVWIHAGDVGSAEVLAELRRRGCEHIVRGNVDHGIWALGSGGLPSRREVEVGSLRVLVVHDRLDLEAPEALAAQGFGMAVFGHSHRPSVELCDGLWLVNPGSCGPRRFHLPVTVARAVVDPSTGAWIAAPEIVELPV